MYGKSKRRLNLQYLYAYDCIGELELHIGIGTKLVHGSGQEKAVQEEVDHRHGHHDADYPKRGSADAVTLKCCTSRSVATKVLWKVV